MLNITKLTNAVPQLTYKELVELFAARGEVMDQSDLVGIVIRPSGIIVSTVTSTSAQVHVGMKWINDDADTEDSTAVDIADITLLWSNETNAFIAATCDGVSHSQSEFYSIYADK